MTEQELLQQDNREQSWNNESFIAIRLDTERIMKKIEYFLSNKRLILKQDDNTGQWYEEAKQVGEPLANEQGVSSILQLVESAVNPQSVQGNFDADQYETYLYYTRVEITKAILSSCYEWGINDSRTEMIIDNIMRFVEPFMSRLLDNKERDSYRGSFQSREVVMQDPNKRGGLARFTGGMGK